MWFLTCFKGTDYLLLCEKEHLVGRRDGDLVLADDQSVSRKHAIISVKHDVTCLGNPSKLPVVILTDCSSKYGIFINDGIEQSVKMASGTNRILQDGDRIRFGLQWNVWRLEYRPLMVTASTLTSAQKNKLKEHILKLGGHLVSNWQDSVTHVTMASITLTVKVVCALAQGRPIVTPQFWEQYVSAISSKERVPVCKEFIPPLAETSLNINEVSFDVNENRGKLFVGKKFVFFSDHQYNNYLCVITAAGGTACRMNESEVDVESLIEPGVIVIQYSFPRQTQDSEFPDSVQEVTSFLKSKGRHAIPESELGLAILYCSLEKHCNPELRVASLSLTTKSQQISSQSYEVLALDTPVTDTESPKEKIVIPDSRTLPKIIKQTLFVPQNAAMGKIKRERLSTASDEVNVVENPHKKMRLLEEDDLHTKALKPSGSRISPTESQVKVEVKDEFEDDDKGFEFSQMDSPNNVFAFSQEPETTQFETCCIPSPKPAQFSKKRKEVGSEIEPVKKKPFLEKDSFNSLDNPIQHKLSVNEFKAATSEKKENKSSDDIMSTLSKYIDNMTVIEVKPLIAQIPRPKCDNFKAFTKVRVMRVEHVIKSKDMVSIRVGNKGLYESCSDTVDDDYDNDWIG